MLLPTPVRVTRPCPRRGSVFTSLGLVAVVGVAASFGLKAAQAALKPQDPPKIEPKKTEPKKLDRQYPRPLTPELPRFVFPDFQGVLGKMQPGFDPKQFDDVQKQMEEIRREHRQAREDLARSIRQANQLPGLRIVPRVPATGRPGSGRGNALFEDRLGAMVEPPSAALIDQLDLPKEQGLVVNDVVPESAAAKAGLKPNDILLELNGQSVPSKVSEFVHQLEAVKANAPVDAIVLRKGKKETVKGLSLPEAPTNAPKPAKTPGR